MIELSGATPSLRELDKNEVDFDCELADHMDGRPDQWPPNCGSCLAVEAAHRSADVIERRRKMVEAWVQFIDATAACDDGPMQMGGCMKAWESAYEKRQWDDVENWGRSTDDAQDLRALLDLLRRDVPRIKIENGMETDERHVHPNEVSEEWRGGAEVLYLGELEAKFTRDPPEDLTQWNEVSASTAQMMQEFLAAQEVTEGDSALSRRAHAEAALELLSVIEREVAAMSAEINLDGDKPDDRAWLAAVIAQTATAAFKVGVHARAAVGKEIERHAVRGQKSLVSSEAGGKARSASTKAMNTAVVTEMKRLIASEHSVSGAAHLAFNKDLGTSSDSNRKIYYRHGPKKK